MMIELKQSTGRDVSPLGRIVVLIPAHDEEQAIARCVEHVLAQSRVPERVVVIAHNCSDGTAEQAREAGAEVMEVEGGSCKADALNEAFERLDDALAPEDVLMVVDADSYLSSGFVANGAAWLEKGYSAVGGVFRGRDDVRGGLVSRYVAFCEQQEYLRYERDVARKGGKALTLTGTAMMIRVAAAREVRDSRPYRRLYTRSSLVEDLEISVRLVNLGHRVVAPVACSLTTETMSGFRKLWKQRVRWKEGAVRTVMQYGPVRGTRTLTLMLAWGALGMLAVAAYFATLIWGIGTGHFRLYPIWIAASAIFALEHAVTVYRRGGPVRALVGATLLFEMPYELFLLAAHAYSYYRAVFRPSTDW